MDIKPTPYLIYGSFYPKKHNNQGKSPKWKWGPMFQFDMPSVEKRKDFPRKFAIITQVILILLARYS
jgi:hypothetical protein